jgi:hypothetical protein
MAQGEYMFKRTLFAEGIFRWMDAAAARFASPFLRERGKVRVIRATETVGTNPSPQSSPLWPRGEARKPTRGAR